MNIAARLLTTVLVVLITVAGACSGAEKLPESLGLWTYKYETDLTKRIDNIHAPYPCAWINTAWGVMILRQGLVPERNMDDIAGAIIDFWKEKPKGYTGTPGLQRYVAKKLGQNVAGNLTMVRTHPPMKQQMDVRYKLMKVICMIHDFQETLLDLAEKHKGTIMPGYTHIRHAQPMTFGHYLLSVFDPIQRSMKTVEDGYVAMSLNELGCGALAGTSWPIDRNMVSMYLGLEGLIENTNDAVAYTDGYVLLVSGLTNVVTVFSRLALDLNYWSSLEYGFLAFDMGAGSYMMPNKTTNQPILERGRVAAAKMLGHLSEVAAMGMRCPQGDMHEMLHMADGTLAALDTTHQYMHVFIYLLPTTKVNADMMLATARQGYSCATELANQIVRDYDLDYRTGHEIVNLFVKASVQKGIPASEARTQMLDTAAQEVIGRKLGMSDETLRHMLDPVHFIEVTNSQGSVGLQEVDRMLKDRRQQLAEARARHLARIERLERAKQMMLDDLHRVYEKSKAE